MRRLAFETEVSEVKQQCLVNKFCLTALGWIHGKVDTKIRELLGVNLSVIHFEFALEVLRFNATIVVAQRHKRTNVRERLWARSSIEKLYIY